MKPEGYMIFILLSEFEPILLGIVILGQDVKFSVDWSILLLLQVQRIPDYEKYLSDLLEDTDPQHPDYEDLSKAANRAKTVSQW